MPHNKTYLSNLDNQKLNKIKEVKLAKLKKVEFNSINDANDAFEKVYDTIREYRNETKDLEKTLKNFQDILAELKDYEFIVDEGINQLDEAQKQAEKSLQELEDGASALGLAVNDIDIYMQLLKSLDDIEDFDNELTKYYQDITDII